MSLSLRSILLVLLLSSFFLGPFLGQARASGAPVLSIFSNDYFSPDIADLDLPFGSVFPIDVTATDLPPIVAPNSGGINGFDITVTFDPNVLNATDANWEAPLCTDADGCLFDSPPSIPLAREISPGRVRLATVILAATIDGSGTLFKIMFKVVGTGSTAIDIVESLSSLTGPVDGQIQLIPYKSVDGSFDNRKPFALSIDPVSAGISSGESVKVEVNATLLWNRVGFFENVTLSANGLPIGASASFNPSSRLVNFTSQMRIDTSPTTPSGTYSIAVIGSSQFTSPVTGTVFDVLVSVNLSLGVGIRDLAVLSVNPQPSLVVVGEEVTVFVSVKNEGSRAETFVVSVSGNGILVASSSEINLGPGQEQTANIAWNTAGYQPGSYIITAEVPRLDGENDLDDNARSGGSVSVAADFEISLNPASAFVAHGQTLDVTVSLTLVSPTGEPVSLSVTDVPAGVSASFSQSTITPPGSSTLTITVSSSAAVGTSRLQLRGTSPTSLVRFATLFLTVTLATHDVAVTSIDFNPKTANSGQTITVTVGVQNQGTFSESFTVRILAGQSQVATSNLVDLAPGVTGTIEIAWTVSTLAPSSYDIVATVSPVPDELDSTDNSMTSTTKLRVNAPPTARFLLTPDLARAGQQIQFDATSSTDSDGSIAIYSWDFGDGSTASGATTTHVFQATGTYTISLTVIDSDGAQAAKPATQTITVSPAVSPPQGTSLVDLLLSPLGLTGIGAAVALVLGLGLFLARKRGGRPVQKEPSR